MGNNRITQVCIVSALVVCAVTLVIVADLSIDDAKELVLWAVETAGE